MGAVITSNSCAGVHDGFGPCPQPWHAHALTFASGREAGRRRVVPPVLLLNRRTYRPGHKVSREKRSTNSNKRVSQNRNKIDLVVNRISAPTTSSRPPTDTSTCAARLIESSPGREPSVLGLCGIVDLPGRPVTGLGGCGRLRLSVRGLYRLM